MSLSPVMKENDPSPVSFLVTHGHSVNKFRWRTGYLVSNPGSTVLLYLSMRQPTEFIKNKNVF